MSGIAPFTITVSEVSVTSFRALVTCHLHKETLPDYIFETDPPLCSHPGLFFFLSDSTYIMYLLTCLFSRLEYKLHEDRVFIATSLEPIALPGI